MGPLASRCFLAFDAASVAGAVVARRFGRPVIRSFASEALPAGALNPLPSERNIFSSEEVRRGVRGVAEALGLGDVRVSLMLPDGVARILLLEAPEGVTPLEYARFRLASSLPYPAGEALIDGVPLGRGRILAAAVRRRVVEEYEEVLAPLTLVQDRLDLSPLAAVSALLRQPAPAGTVDVILGDAAFSMARHDEAGLCAFRSRRRDPGSDEALRLRDDARRTLAPPGVRGRSHEVAGAPEAGAPGFTPGASCPTINEGEPRLRVVGSGAGVAIRGLLALGSAAEAGWDFGGEGPALGGAEQAWLGGALA